MEQVLSCYRACKLNGQMVVAIVDTGSAGVVISKSCFDRLGLVSDDEVEFTITLATDTNKKLRKVLFGVEVTVGKNTVTVLAIVLEGLHFDVLLGVSWLKEAKAKILLEEGVIEVNGEHIIYKSCPKPALFIAEDGIRIYCDQFTVLTPGKVMGVPVRHLAVTGGDVYYVQYKDGYHIEGEFLKVADSKGFLYQCEIKCVGQSEVVL